MPLDQFEENRRPVLHRFGEHLQQVAVLVAVGENTYFTQDRNRYPGVAYPLAQRVVVRGGGVQELHSAVSHRRDSADDVAGRQRDVLYAWTAVELQILVDL